MKIEFNQTAYNAFKGILSLQKNPKEKLLTSLPFVSTCYSIYTFHELRIDNSINTYQRVAFGTIAVLGLIPGVNLSLYLVLGLGTLVSLAIDGIRAQLNKKKSQNF